LQQMQSWGLRVTEPLPICPAAGYLGGPLSLADNGDYRQNMTETLRRKPVFGKHMRHRHPLHKKLQGQVLIRRDLPIP
jgi:hypothetical protein